VSGATELSLDVARDGIVGRGVLLDIPRLEGRRWLEPGESVTGEALAAAETAQHVTVGPGDLLFIRVGHRPRRDHYGPWDAAQARAGLHPAAMQFLAERRVALLGSDSNNDTAPSVVAGVGFPVHVLAIHAMGMHLLDYLHFEALLALCEEQDRWAFMCVIAPLRLPAATGSPINPIGDPLTAAHLERRLTPLVFRGDDRRRGPAQPRPRSSIPARHLVIRHLAGPCGPESLTLALSARPGANLGPAHFVDQIA
jgi:kynurenine formamidase